MKKKLQQAETNCLKTMPPQGYFSSERTDRPLGSREENRFLTSGLESAVFWRAQGKNSYSPLNENLFYRKWQSRGTWSDGNCHHQEVFFQHFAGEVEGVWVCFILLQLSSLPWFLFFIWKAYQETSLKNDLLILPQTRSSEQWPLPSRNSHHCWNGCWVAHKEIQGIFRYS